MRTTAHEAAEDGYVTMSHMSSGYTQKEHIFEKSKVIETYDSSGNRIEVADYDLEGNLQLKTTYRYDDRGNDVHRLITDENGKQVRRLELQYDEKDRVAAYQEYNRKDELVYRLVAEYDYAPKMARIRMFDKDGNVISEEFKVPDAKGNVLF